ncbi:7947_t:CDS:2, partial [Scutellospora calospora]
MANPGQTNSIQSSEPDEFNSLQSSETNSIQRSEPGEIHSMQSIETDEINSIHDKIKTGIEQKYNTNYKPRPNVKWFEKAISDGNINFYGYGEFSDIEKISDGGFSFVTKSEWKNGGLTVALK